MLQGLFELHQSFPPHVTEVPHPLLEQGFTRVGSKKVEGVWEPVREGREGRKRGKALFSTRENTTNDGSSRAKEHQEQIASFNNFAKN